MQLRYSFLILWPLCLFFQSKFFHSCRLFYFVSVLFLKLFHLLSNYSFYMLHIFDGALSLAVSETSSLIALLSPGNLKKWSGFFVHCILCWISRLAYCFEFSFLLFQIFFKQIYREIIINFVQIAYTHLNCMWKHL